MLQISTRLIYEEAKARGWKAEPLDERFVSTLAITPTNDRTYYFDSCQPPLTSAAAMAIADNKLSTYMIAQTLDIPVAAFEMYSPQTAPAFLETHKDIVVKPIDTNHGDGITVGVTTPDELTDAVAFAHNHSKKILLQERHYGGDCRVLVVNRKVVAASQRVPAFVVGDGTHTVRELIERKNEDKTRAGSHDSHLSTIDVPASERFLGDAMSKIPAANEHFTVMGTSNLSRGGEAHDITDSLHPSFKEAAQRMAVTLDMFICGADFMALDHTKPLEPGNAVLLEINATPGIRMHHFPRVGTSRNVAKVILDEFYNKITSTNK